MTQQELLTELNMLAEMNTPKTPYNDNKKAGFNMGFWFMQREIQKLLKRADPHVEEANASERL